MIRKILTALDGTPASESILPYLRMMLALEDANVTLVRVAWTPKDDERRASGDYLSGIAEALRKEGASVKVEVLWGDPAEEIVRLAVEGAYDLVMLASRGKRGLKRWVMGSVAEKVLRHLPVPAFVAHPFGKDERPAPIRKILVPLDGSHRSASVVAPAAALAARLGASIDLLSVVTPRRREKLPVEVAAPNLFRTEKALKERGLEAKLEILMGDPATEILAYAKEKGAGLIALSTHGRTGLDRAVYGSVAETVLRKGRLPLLILRTAAVPRLTLHAAAQKARHRAYGKLKPVSFEHWGHYP